MILQFHQFPIHTDTGWKLGIFGMLFVSPSFHEIHQSKAKQHINENYGGVLTISDHIFNSYLERIYTKLSYGLVNEKIKEKHHFSIFCSYSRRI